MKYDILLVGVGGQGVLSVAAAIARGAMLQGLNVLQSETHGMSQRGGAVSATLRISDREIFSSILGTGTADLILSMEPLESLRYLRFLKREGTLVTSLTPVKNIKNYPPMEEVVRDVKKIAHSVLVDSDSLAREAGSHRSGNIVMVGAAANFLPLELNHLKNAICEIFASKGQLIIDTNLKALELGKRNAQHGQSQNHTGDSSSAQSRSTESNRA